MIFLSVLLSHREKVGDFPFFPRREKVDNFRLFHKMGKSRQKVDFFTGKENTTLLRKVKVSFPCGQGGKEGGRKLTPSSSLPLSLT